ncbi:MAG TPA: 50S ribosomal protein L25 [Opitutae bacterium]|nr:50S ribosomal protein L25 [Opitutae bacterium]|tara:strand:- start:1390 stop:2052 length:663 start_codon:yes stop_codon:yes gene_type:complete
MKELNLQVAAREAFGRRNAGRLRASGQIPAVLYGPSGNQALQVKESDLRNLMRTMGDSVAFVRVQKGNNTTLSMVKEIVRDSCSDRFVHVDFQEISQKAEADFTVPIHTTGEAVGVKNESGILELVMHEIHVHCLPSNLPSSIDIDVSGLHVGDAIHIKELPAFPGVTFSGDLDSVVVSCSAPKIEAESTEDVAEDGEETAAEDDTKAKASEEAEEASKE